MSPRFDRTALWLALGLWLVFLFTSPGGLESGDAVLRYETARSWLAGQGGALSGKLALEDAVVVAPNGATYSFFGPLQSVLMVPFVLAARLLPDLTVDPNVVETFVLALGLFPAISTAAIVLLYLALRDLGHDRSNSLLASVGIGLGSLFFHYARSGQEESLVALGFALWLYGAARLTRGRTAAATLMAAGGAIALATRWATVPQLVGLLAATSILLWRERRLISKSVVAAGLLLAIACLGLLLWYNYVRFGDPTETGYGIFFDSRQLPMFGLEGYGRHLAALLISPYRGLLWYSPIVVAAMVGTWYLRPGTERLLGVTALAVLVTSVLFIAAYRIWGGGHSWGPRFLVSPQVLLAPALAALLTFRPRSRLLLAPLIALQLFSTALPASTEEYVWFNLNRERTVQCNEWRFECTAVGQRIPLALRALANTIADRPGEVIVGRPATVAPERVLSTSDYRTLYWWPVRIGLRMRLFPSWVGLLICCAGLAAASAALRQAWRWSKNADTPIAGGVLLD